MVDNPHITTGYRIGFHTFKQALRSFFMWHNETLNVWTHFCGKILFMGLIFVTLMIIPSYGQHGYELQAKLKDYSSSQ
jgi:adiponectin receptor